MTQLGSNGRVWLVPALDQVVRGAEMVSDRDTAQPGSPHVLVVSRPYKEIFKQSITYSGPIIWNSLPSGLKSIDKTDTFHSNFIKWMKNP